MSNESNTFDGNGKSITNSFDITATNITVEKDALIKGDLTVLGNTNIGNILVDNASVNNLTVNDLLTLHNPLPISSGGTGLSTVGSSGQVLTSTGSGLQYTTPVSSVTSVTATTPVTSTGGTTPNIALSTVPTSLGGTGLSSIGSANQVLAVNSSGTALQYTSSSSLAVTSVTASSPLASSGGSTPNISIASSTGSGAVVLQTDPTIINSLVVNGPAYTNSPNVKTVIEPLYPSSTVGVGIVRSSSDAFGLNIETEGYGLGNVKRIKILTDEVCVANDNNAGFEMNQFNVLLNSTMSTTNFKKNINLYSDTNEENAILFWGQPPPWGSTVIPRIKIASTGTGVFAVDTFSMTSTEATMNITSGSGDFSFTTGLGDFSVTNGVGAINLTNGGGAITITNTSGALALSTAGGILSLATGAGAMTLTTGAGAMTLTTGAGVMTLTSLASIFITAPTIEYTGQNTFTGNVSMFGALEAGTSAFGNTTCALLEVLGQTTLTGNVTVFGAMEAGTVLFGNTTCAALEVLGIASLNGDVNILGAMQLEGNFAILGAIEGGTAAFGNTTLIALEVIGFSTFVGGVNITGGMALEGGGNIVGAIGIEGGLNVTGGGIFEGAVNIAGFALLEGGMNLAGGFTLEGGGNITGGLGVEGGANIFGGGSVEGEFNVTGICTMEAEINVFGYATFEGGINLAGGFTLEGGGNVTGGLAVEGGLNVTGVAGFEGGINVAGAAGVEGGANISGGLAVEGGADVAGGLGVEGAFNVVGASTCEGTLVVYGLTSLNAATNILGLLTCEGSANFVGTNLTSLVYGIDLAGVYANLTCTTGNIGIASGNGAVKIAANEGGVSIGGNGNGWVGQFEVNAESGIFGYQTGNISFKIRKTPTAYGPGNFTIDTTQAPSGDMYVSTKGKVAIASRGSSYAANLNTSFITPASYEWCYPETAGTLNSILLSGAGSAAMTWLSPGTAGTFLYSDGTNIYWNTSSVDWNSPGTIGYTTPNSGAFTSLSASENIISSQNINSGVLILNNGNTSLTVNSPKTVLIRGGSGSTITLPDATTLAIGFSYEINNNSNNTATVNTYTGTLVTTVLAGQYMTVFLLTNPNTSGTWDYHISGGLVSVSATSPIISSGGSNPTISISPTVNFTSIGATTPGTGAFTTLSSTSSSTTPFIVSSSAVTANGTLAQFLLPNSTTSGNTSAMVIGQSTSANASLYISYVYNSTLSNSTALFGFNGSAPLITLSAQGTVATGPLSATSMNNTPIGSTTPNTGAFTTLSATGQITSTLATGTAPFSITSTTVVPNLNVSQLLGSTWASPGTIGSTTPNTGAFTTLTTAGTATINATSSGVSLGQYFASATTGDTVIHNLGASSANGSAQLVYTHDTTVGSQTFGLKWTGQSRPWIKTNYGGGSTPSGYIFMETAALVLTQNAVNTVSIMTPSSFTSYNYLLPASMGNSGQCLVSQGSSTTPIWQNRVSSVDMTVPSFLSVSGNPITSSGTLAVTYSGTALPVANGGTGLTSVGTNGQVLTSNGTSIYWAAASTTNWASPGPIGSTTPNTGAFTTLSASASNSSTTSGVFNVSNSSTSTANIATFFAPSLLSGNVSTLHWGRSASSGLSSTFTFGYNSVATSGFAQWSLYGGFGGNAFQLNGDGTNLIAGNTSFSNQIISTLATGTAPLSISSTTVVPNLNVSQLLGSTWDSPGTIGSTTPNTGAFTTLSASASSSTYSSGVLNVTNTFTTGSSTANFLAPNLLSTNGCSIFVGKAISTVSSVGQAAEFKFVYNSTPSSCYTVWQYYGGTPGNSIRLNGDGTNTINGSTTISGSTASSTSGIFTVSNTNTSPLISTYILTPNILSGQPNILCLGQSSTANNAIYMSYNHNSTASAVSYNMYFAGQPSPEFKMTNNGTISLTGITTVSGPNSSTSSGVFNVSNSSTASNNMATFFAPSLLSGNISTLHWGRSASSGLSSTFTFGYNSVATSVFAQWALYGGFGGNAFQLNGDGTNLINGNTTVNGTFVANGTTSTPNSLGQGVTMGIDSNAAFIQLNSVSTTASYIDFSTNGTSYYTRIQGNSNSTMEYLATNSAFRATSGAEGAIISTGGIGGAASGYTGTAGMKIANIATYATNFMFNATATDYITFYSNTGTNRGSLLFNGSNMVLTTASDYRLKENIAPLTGALYLINQLKPSTYNFEETITTGFIAHELEEYLPEAVYGEKDEVDENGDPKYQSVSLATLIPFLTGAIQELSAQVTILQARITALESQ